MSKVSRFKSMNYSRVVCEGCGNETTIEPGAEFSELSCGCDGGGYCTEVSTPVQEEEDYTQHQTITVIGRFKNGDYEVINANDANDSWRVPKDTFESTYEETIVIGDAGTTVVTLSLNDIKDKTADEVKDAYTLNELRVLGEELKVKGYHNMRESKLIKILKEKAE